MLSGFFGKWVILNVVVERKSLIITLQKRTKWTNTNNNTQFFILFYREWQQMLRCIIASYYDKARIEQNRNDSRGTALFKQHYHNMCDIMLTFQFFPIFLCCREASRKALLKTVWKKGMQYPITCQILGRWLTEQAVVHCSFSPLSTAVGWWKGNC